MDKKMDFVFDKIFKEYYGKNKMLFKNYELIYNLPTVKSECDVSKKLFEYCLRKKFFILLLVYDDEGKVYLDRNMSDILCWGLPGGSIKDDETINHAINRISKYIDNNIIIGDIEPITIIENKFNYKRQSYIHYGLGFIARVRNKHLISKEKLTGNFIEITKEETNYINRLASKKMVEIFKCRYNDIVSKTNNCFQEEEILSNEKYIKRYKIHNKFVKRFILTERRKKKEEFKNIITKMLDKPNSIIDVSCGEDKFIFNLSRELNIPLVVGNDISWSQIEILNKQYEDVIFTNHNAASLPFKNRIFDVSYCSNTLHHMPNKKTLINLLNSLYNVSNKIIIVEIENPKVTGGFPKWLNKNWYMGYLKDAGGAYLSEQQFKVIINEIFNTKAEVKFNCFRNIMGNYMIAEICRKD